MENNGIKNGLFMGVASVLFSMILYFINPKMMFGGVAYLGFLIPLYFMWKAGTDERQSNGGYLSFGGALKVTFLSIVVGFLISNLFSYVLINFIDPSLIEVIRETSMETAEKMAGMFGGNEDVMEEMKDAMEEQDFSPTLGSTLLTYLVGLIFPGFVFALIISAIVKKDDPSNV